MALVKKTKFWSLYECKDYNARQFMTQFLDKGWIKNSINRLLVSSEQSTGVQAVADAFAHTDENVDTIESLVLTQTQKDKPQSHWTVIEISDEAGGSIDHQFRGLCTKICVSCYKKSRAQQLTEAHSMHSILESFENFCQISSKSIHKILIYTVAKLVHFSETQCSSSI